MLDINRVIVTGGEGFIGRHIVRHYLEKGAEVWSIDKRVGKSVFPDELRDKGRLRTYSYSLHNFLTFATDVSRFSPDLIVHAAGEPDLGVCHFDPAHAHACIVDNTWRVLRAVRISNIPRFVYLSSAMVYPGTSDLTPIQEGMPLEPVNVYGLCVRAAERSIDSYNELGFSCCSLRIANVYGDGGQGVIDKYDFRGNNTVGEEASVPFSPNVVTRDSIHVDDVVSAIDTVAPLQVIRESLNVSSGETFTARELVERMGLDPLPTDPPQYAEPTELLLDTGKLRALGWEPKQSLNAYLESLKQPS